MKFAQFLLEAEEEQNQRPASDVARRMARAAERLGAARPNSEPQQPEPVQPVQPQEQPPEQPRQLQLDLSKPPVEPQQAEQPVAQFKYDRDRLLANKGISGLIDKFDPNQQFDRRNMQANIERLVDLLPERMNNIGDYDDDDLVGFLGSALTQVQDGKETGFNYLNDDVINMIAGNSSFRFDDDNHQSLLQGFLQDNPRYDDDVDKLRALATFSGLDLSEKRAERLNNLREEGLFRVLDKYRADGADGELEGKQINNLMKLLGDGDLEKFTDVLYMLDKYNSVYKKGTAPEDSSLKGSEQFVRDLFGEAPRGDANTMSTFLRAVMDSYGDVEDDEQREAFLGDLNTALMQQKHNLWSDMGIGGYNIDDESDTEDNAMLPFLGEILKGLDPDMETLDQLPEYMWAAMLDNYMDEKFFDDVAGDTYDGFGNISHSLSSYQRESVLDYIKNNLISKTEDWGGDYLDYSTMYNEFKDDYAYDDDMGDSLDIVQDLVNNYDSDYVDMDAVENAFSDNRNDPRGLYNDLDNIRDNANERQSGKSDDYEHEYYSGNHTNFSLQSYYGWNSHDVEDAIRFGDLEAAGLNMDDVVNTNRSVYIEWSEDIDEDIVNERFEEYYEGRIMKDRGGDDKRNIEDEKAKFGERLAALDAVKTWKEALSDLRPGTIVYNTPIDGGAGGNMREVLYGKMGFGRDDGGQFGVVGTNGKVFPINDYTKEEKERMAKERQASRRERRENEKKEGPGALVRARDRAVAKDDRIRARFPDVNRRIDRAIDNVPVADRLRTGLQNALDRVGTNRPSRQDAEQRRVIEYARDLRRQGWEVGGYVRDDEMRRRLQRELGGYVWRELTGPNGEKLYYDGLTNRLVNDRLQPATPRRWQRKPGGQFPNAGNTGRDVPPEL